jgi:flagellar biosynthetic protein FliR
MRLRIMLPLIISLVLAPLLPASQMPTHTLTLAVALLNEIMVGTLMGLAIRIVFATIEFGGHLISNEISLSHSQSLNPFNTEPTSTVGTMLFYCGIFIFFTTGMHREMLWVILRSYELAPAGDIRHSLHGADCFVRETANIFLIGLRMGAPLLVLNFLINMTFSVLGKAAPKINVFLISFAARILAGLLLLAFTLKLILHYVYEMVTHTPQKMLELIVN